MLRRNAKTAEVALHARLTEIPCQVKIRSHAVERSFSVFGRLETEYFDQIDDLGFGLCQVAADLLGAVCIEAAEVHKIEEGLESVLRWTRRKQCLNLPRSRLKLRTGPQGRIHVFGFAYV